MVTRSQSGIVKPVDRLSLHTSSISPISKSPFLALNDPYWCNSMYDEYNALVKNSTWILVPRPTSVNLVRSMWLFKHKFHADGTLNRYKARLVANGGSQQLGVDFDGTFSPVVKPATIHTVLSLVVSPPGFVDSRYPHHVCLLQRSLYGLKQALRAWFQRFAGYATRIGFYHNCCDPSLFIYRQCSQVAYLLIYVDDIILTSSSPALLQQIIDSLHSEFDMTNLGALNYFLVISVVSHATELFLSQRKYALQLLERAHMVNCNPSRTPVDTESKLGPKGVHAQDPTLYRSLAGGLYTPSPAQVPKLNIRVLLTLWSRLHGFVIFFVSYILLYRLPTLVYCDNVRAIYISANPVQHQRTKHVEINIHFVRDMVTAGEVRVLHVPSRYQYADIFTNGLPSALFEEFRLSLSLRPPPAPTAGDNTILGF
ncbi:ribonuclease H-like domain-containing protein [Tanacetum coccineum]